MGEVLRLLVKLSDTCYSANSQLQEYFRFNHTLSMAMLVLMQILSVA